MQNAPIWIIFAFEKYRDLETRVRGHSRSLEIIPFDRSYMKYQTFSYGTGLGQGSLLIGFVLGCLCVFIFWSCDVVDYSLNILSFQST